MGHFPLSCEGQTTAIKSTKVLNHFSSSLRKQGDRKHAGEATPHHAHFDGGRGGVFERGFPFANEKSSWLSADELDDALLQVLSAQVAIQVSVMLSLFLNFEYTVFRSTR